MSGADADGTAGAGANGGRSADGAGTAEQSDLSSRLNILRAGVLGANDGIVSTAGLVLGVAATTTATGPILTAGLAGLVAGALSMASGEYVSVSTQRDTEQAALDLGPAPLPWLRWPRTRTASCRNSPASTRARG